MIDDARQAELVRELSLRARQPQVLQAIWFASLPEAERAFLRGFIREKIAPVFAKLGRALLAERPGVAL